MVDALNPGTSAERATELHALLLLDQAEGIGPRRILRLVERFGSAARALGAPARSFEAVAGVPRATVALPEHRARVEEALRQARRLGIDVLGWRDEAYPERLRALHDPPPVLFLRGRQELLGRPAVAVVGARRATARGRDLARRLGEQLARGGAVVVSGLALGVDGAAHQGALDGGGPTIAVVGRGADLPYPPSHRRLFRRILEQGLVVSEFIPGTPSLPHHFPRRNRIMAALADTLVVVEAGTRSGALITVEHALDLGREVWSVPGPIDTPSCAGSNGLLAEGARPLVSIERFVAEAGLSSPPAAEDAPGPSSESELRLLEGLRAGPAHVDELASRAGLAIPIALALLVELELRGAVEQMPGLFFRSAA